MLTISPYRPLRMFDLMNRLLDDVLPREGAYEFPLPLDVTSTNDEFIITASVPGLKPEDLNVEVVDSTVTIQGELPGTPRGDKETCLLQERNYGKFTRSVTLPAELEGSKAEATIENGVLTLRIPKAEVAKPRQIKVKVK